MPRARLVHRAVDSPGACPGDALAQLGLGASEARSRRRSREFMRSLMMPHRGGVKFAARPARFERAGERGAEHCRAGNEGFRGGPLGGAAQRNPSRSRREHALGGGKFGWREPWARGRRPESTQRGVRRPTDHVGLRVNLTYPAGAGSGIFRPTETMYETVCSPDFGITRVVFTICRLRFG